MKALQYKNHGGPEVIQMVDVPEPSPKSHELLIRIEATSLNHLDIHVRRGLPGVKIPLPHIPGCDGAGVIEAVGSQVEGWEPGQRVVIDPSLSCGNCDRCHEGDISSCHQYKIIGEHTDGTCAEKIVIPAQNAVRLPDRFEAKTAAAAGLVFLTAWHMVVTKGQVKPGDCVLVMGAGSGVSMAAIQIAKRIGAEVITTAGSTEKANKAKDLLGVSEVILYQEESIDRAIRKLTSKRGVDVIIDHVGGEQWIPLLRSLRNGGTLVTCGCTAGYEPKEDLRQIFFRQLRILGSTMGNHSEFKKVMALVFNQQLNPILDSEYAFEDMANAQKRMEERKSFGKIVLTP